MNKRLTMIRKMASGVFTLTAITIAQAQISPLSDAEKNMRPGAAPSSANSNNNASASLDPGDFSGSWRSGGGPGSSGGMGAGGPPGGAQRGAPGVGGPGGAPDAGAPPGADGAPNGGISPAGNPDQQTQLPARILCLPQEPLYTGVDGPTTITQTPELINWSSEEMHHHRRIYLTGTLPVNPAPSYLGVSVGKWEGNTLVVETVGLRSQKAGTRMIEKWNKSEDGKTLNIAVSYVDAAGKATSGRNISLNWANGQETLEWICEDFNEEWLPGGTDYEDQANQSGG